MRYEVEHDSGSRITDASLSRGRENE